ncbi:apolipoprotein N-acyltransferase [Sphingomonas sp.]|uniref:apolipoprotein N-acyltransferase n=1 Tax=Sphingomonas sp. TaxID=28214 RepID=UPI0025D43BC3|nr:apolipoprotein N-acyltransferase [Sphingomonas sp.]
MTICGLGGTRIVIWLRRLLPLALGANAALGFAPWDSWQLTIAGFALWLFLVHEAGSLRRALGIGWLFGLGHMTVANLWIQQPFEFQDKMPPQLGYIAVVLLAAYLAIFPMLAAGTAWRLGSKGASGDPAPRPDAAFVLVAGAAWTVTEYLRGTLFTGYPWDPLAVIWIPHLVVASAAQFVGTYALSGLTVVVAGALMLLAHRRWRLPLIVALLVTPLLWFPASRVRPASTAGAPIVRIVQPNLPEEARPTDDYAEANFQALARLSGRPNPDHPRLILWPEGAIRFPVEDGYPRYVYDMMGSAQTARIRMASLLGDHDAILTGTQGMYFDKRTENMTAATNSIAVIGADAKLHGRYDKAHLVPYGEYLPMRPVLEAIGLSRLVPGDVDFIPGPGPRTMAIPGFGKVGMLICYEVIFSGQVVDPAHRPDFIFNPSNDAWFGTLGPPAHLAQARLRAIEEGLSVVRATPTGISAIIGPDGSVRQSIPMGEAGAIEGPVLRGSPTLFSRVGNWMALIVSAILLICAIAIRRLAR